LRCVFDERAGTRAIERWAIGMDARREDASDD
jgi:hypothetical protein